MGKLNLKDYLTITISTMSIILLFIIFAILGLKF